jgi:hypothetical protein
MFSMGNNNNTNTNTHQYNLRSYLFNYLKRSGRNCGQQKKVNGAIKKEKREKKGRQTKEREGKSMVESLVNLKREFIPAG